MDKQIDQLLGIIYDLVYSDREGGYEDIRDAILKQATEREQVALDEFVSWFEK